MLLNAHTHLQSLKQFPSYLHWSAKTRCQAFYYSPLDQRRLLASRFIFVQARCYGMLLWKLVYEEIKISQRLPSKLQLQSLSDSKETLSCYG